MLNNYMKYNNKLMKLESPFVKGFRLKNNWKSLKEQMRLFQHSNRNFNSSINTLNKFNNDFNSNLNSNLNRNLNSINKLNSLTCYTSLFSEVKISQLENSARVASLEMKGNLSSIVVTFKDAGTSMNPFPGFIQLLHRLNSLSSQYNSYFRFDSEYTHEFRYFIISFDRNDLHNVVTLLAKEIFHPFFTQQDVLDATQYLKSIYSEESLSMDHLFENLIHAASFGDHPLGKPIYEYPKSNFKYFEKIYSIESINLLMNSLQKSENCAIVGINLEHDELLQLINKYFLFENIKEYNATIHKDFWIHKSLTKEIETTNSCLQGIAFKCPSILDSEFETVLLLDSIVGLGFRNLNREPGSGLLSIAQTEILPKYPFQSLISQLHAFELISFFSIKISCEIEYIDYIPEAIEEICYRVENISEIEFNRAKKKCEARALFALENPIQIAKSISEDILTYGYYKGLDPFNKLKNIDISEFISLWKRIQSEPPSLVAIGPLNSLPKNEKWFPPKDQKRLYNKSL